MKLPDSLLRHSLALGFLLFAASRLSAAETLPGDAVIRGAAGGSEIVITTTSRLAGAIHSLTWKGQEFINSADHGRQLQSASNLDLGTPIQNETFNPTEAGCVRDGSGPTSTSQLLHLVAAGNTLQTTTRMAFWLPPGGESGGQPAKNTASLSDHLLTKRVQIGFKDIPNVILYDVTFGTPVGERHTNAVFEALTGYMPPAFSRFLQFNPLTGELEPLGDGPGEVAHSVVLARPEGTHAMGIYSPPQRAPKTSGPTYGRFNFEGAKVVKWNCVFRVKDPGGIAPADHSFRMFVIVGDLPLVTASLRALHREFETAR